MNAKVMQLTEIIAPAVAALDFELVGCEFIARGSGGILRIYIDNPTGVSIDDCERVSRQVSSVLDVADPIFGKYRLEVSSPGIERPLFTLEHYQHFIGKQIQLRLRLPLAGRRQFTGTIERVQGEKIFLAMVDDTIELPFANVQKAHLVVEPKIGKRDEKGL